MKKLYILFLFILLWHSASAQSLEYGHRAIEVRDMAGNLYSNPFAGGINSGQFSNIDLDQDGMLDLVVFDRTSDKISTFVRRGNTYIYSPEFEPLFPFPLVNWVLLADYNNDGRPDIFTSTNLGIKVYKNTTPRNGALQWELAINPILTQGTALINLFVNSTDLPAITDIDGDGDLDILVFNFASGGYVEYHQNMSMERFGNTNSLVYERITRTWGDFRECYCGEFAYGDAPCITSGRVEHVAGKAITLVDLTNDGKKDLLFSEELCSNLFLIENVGGVPNATFRNGRIAIDALENAMNFPAAYLVDATGDGQMELVVSPNDRRNELDQQDFSRSVYLLEKSSGRYLVTDNAFLQKSMIEVGENSSPVLADVDGNGTIDLLVGNRGSRINGKFVASVSLFRNEGSANQPSYRLVTKDFLNLSSLNLLNIRPKMLDFNKDGLLDLVFTGFNGQSTKLYVLHGTATGLSINSLTEYNLPINELDNFELVDVDSDGQLDLLVGKSTGRLDYYKNMGTVSAPQFQIHTSGFLGLGSNPSRTNLSLLAYDLGTTGSPDLLLYDDSGELRLVRNFKQNQTQIENLLIFGSDSDIRLGRLGTMAMANLSNDGQYHNLIMGNAQGGLFHYLLPTGEQPKGEWEVSVYPNPVNNSPIKIFTNQNAMGTLYALSGQMILGNMQFTARKTVALPIGQLAQGMYILRMQTADNETKSMKIIVHE